VTEPKSVLLRKLVELIQTTHFPEPGVLVSKDPDNYNLETAVEEIKTSLQEIGASRIPPGCRLPHQHYRDPIIHNLETKPDYEVIGITDSGVGRFEYYIRYTHDDIYVGVEAELYSGYSTIGKPKRVSQDVQLYEIVEGNTFYLHVMEFLIQKKLITEVGYATSRRKYLEAKAKLIDELLGH